MPLDTLLAQYMAERVREGEGEGESGDEEKNEEGIVVECLWHHVMFVYNHVYCTCTCTCMYKKHDCKQTMLLIQVCMYMLKQVVLYMYMYLIMIKRYYVYFLLISH